MVRTIPSQAAKLYQQALSPGFKAFLIWTVVLFARPQDFLTFLEPLRIALLFTLVALVTVFFGSRRITINDLLKSGMARKFAVLYLLMIFGIPFADHKGRAFSWTFTVYVINVIYFYLAVFHLDSIKKIKLTAYVLCLSIVFYGIFGLFKGQYIEGRFSLGTMYDPNDLALLMVGLFPISILFLARTYPTRSRITAALVLGIGPLIIIMTGSRGGILSLAVVLLTLLMTRLGRIKRPYKILMLVLAAAALFIFGEQINLERYTTMYSIENDYNITSETGRIEVWKSAFKLINANPITGVGVRCFPRAFGYLRAAEGRTPEWKAAHNAYIQIWTELGYPGIIVFLGMISYCIRVFWRVLNSAGHDSGPNDPNDPKLLGGLLLTGFIGHLCGAFFLSQGYGIQFTLFFALAAVIQQLSLEQAGARKFKTTYVNKFDA